MSREIIVCENCEHIEYRLYDDSEYEKCPNCSSTLKTETVYTEEELQKLKDALVKSYKTLKGVEIFVKSRQRINKPIGEKWFDDTLYEIDQTLEEIDV